MLYLNGRRKIEHHLLPRQTIHSELYRISILALLSERKGGNDPRQTFYSEINFQISKLQSNIISLMDVLCTFINVNFMENV